jgi:hypothetical protein
MREGKVSHSNWKHPQLELLIIIARRDSDDAPRYLEKFDRVVCQIEKIFTHLRRYTM